MSRFREVISASLIGILGCGSCSAAVVSVQNAGFEDTTGQTTFNEFTFGVSAGWNVYDPSNITTDPNVYIGTLQPNGTEFFPVLAPEGNRVAILFNSAQKGAGEYGISQTLSTSIVADTQYTLTVRVGNITSGTAVNNVFYDLSNFPGYRIDLLVGGSVIASDNNTLSIAEGAWGTSTVTFTTGSSVAPDQFLGIRLVSLNATTGTPDNEVDFDDVQLTAVAIPEPSALIFLSCSMMAFLARRSR